MINVDLHPEDLLDKEILGELSDEERARLEAHVAVCKACQFERMAREDFHVELETELAKGDAPKIVNLDRVQPPVVEAPARRAPFRGRVALLVAAALLLVSAVAGAGWVSIRTITSKGQPERTPTELPASEAPSRAPVRAGLRPSPQPVESASPAEPAAEPSSEAIAQPELPPSDALPIAKPEVQPSDALPIAEPEVPPSDAPPIAKPEVRGDALPIAEPEVPHGDSPPIPSAPERTASTLFAEANAARAGGDYAKATRLYAEIQSSFPSSAEARTTQAILGRLLLDRGDAAGALRHYDAYLSGGGGLREEAMVGRATALRRLGRTGEEAAAWSIFLKAYPSSAHADNARKRLAEIGGP